MKSCLNLEQYKYIYLFLSLLQFLAILYLVITFLLKVPWIARSNQSILKEISPKYSQEGLMLKLHYFGHLT